MKTYKDDEIKSWHWCKRQEYIPSSDSIGDGSIVGWQLIEKYPINKIIYNKDSYPNSFPNNSLDLRYVFEMIDEFHPFGFHPIRINKDGVLVDGQHRLKFAQLCCLKFIDVFVE